jgi:hypothetical protein
MKSSELLLLQDVWRKAYAKGSMNIEFKSKAGAVRARMQLYNAVNKIKRGSEVADVPLARAAEELEIVWVNDTTIRLQKRAESDMMQGLMAAVGQSVEEYQDPEMLEASDRLLRDLERQGLMSSAPAPAPTEDSRPAFEHQANPFFPKRG